MKKLTAVIMIITLGIISPLSFSATLASMSKDQVQQALINKTTISIATDNLNGKTIYNTFSEFLDSKGNILGKMSLKPANEPQTDKGVYSIKDDGTLLITWQHWDGGKQLCAHFFETKNAYIAIDCANVFHTVFMKDAIKPGNHLK
jgi:hypothetical protein